MYHEKKSLLPTVTSTYEIRTVNGEIKSVTEIDRDPPAEPVDRSLVFGQLPLSTQRIRVPMEVVAIHEKVLPGFNQ